MRNISPVFLAFVFIFLSSSCKKESINNANRSTVGASAKDLLSDSKYQSIRIQIQYMPGFQPDVNSMNNMLSFLNGLVKKPGGISITQSAIASSGKSVLSLDEINAIENKNRTVFTSGNVVGVYLLFTDAAYTDPNVLGIAYANTSLCLMGKTIHDNSSGIGQSSRVKLESAVGEHEFGHILGLVNIGSPMQVNHVDVAHGNHCNNSNCLMYYATETTDILGFLITGSIPALDTNCLVDLHANGGK